jgi:hypothetical protein
VTGIDEVDSPRGVTDSARNQEASILVDRGSGHR